MPTPEIAEALAKVNATRSRLLEITKKLQDSEFDNTAAGYVQLQNDWDEAFRAFVAAAAAFSATVKENAEARSRAAGRTN